MIYVRVEGSQGSGGGGRRGGGAGFKVVPQKVDMRENGLRVLHHRTHQFGYWYFDTPGCRALCTAPAAITCIIAFETH